MLTYIKNSRYQVMVMILGVLAAVSLACRFSQQPEPPLMTPPGAPTATIVTPTIEEIFVQPES